MAIVGISKLETEEFISSHDMVDTGDGTSKQATKSEGATVWQIGVLDSDIRAVITDKAMVLEQHVDGNRILSQAGTRNLMAVRFGLRGWENFKHEDGSDIAYETEERMISGKIYTALTDKCLESIPGYLVTELGQEIIARNMLDAETRKNLSGALSR